MNMLMAVKGIGSGVISSAAAMRLATALWLLCVTPTGSLSVPHGVFAGLARRASMPLPRLPIKMEVPEPRILTEENAKAVLEECTLELGTLFGTNAESLSVGITGGLEFVELSGPMIVISLTGRFWHQRSVVVDRVSKYVLDRIPECVDVEIVDAAQLDDTDASDLERKYAELDALDAADVAKAAAMAEPWEEYVDDESGTPYYHNRETGESVWERPAAMDETPALAPYSLKLDPKGPKRQGTGGASFGNDGGKRPDQF